MKTQVDRSHRFEFCFPTIDTLVLVEQFDEHVTIRATRDTFSEPRKLAFVHELAAEGFIPDEFQWQSAPVGDGSSARLRWWLDSSWLTLSPELRTISRRFMFRLLGGGMITWLALVGMLFCFRVG